ncbi:ral GTPase-activating protein subunit alpha-2-like isoform X2 [Mustela putorius furo]|uniref:Ral GTPase-activating protein subunit alpha-2-like isoform X2 n=1 Tax=Mustela putorius furo TaxID=9669 RepID=A0A8U0RJV6_MUSPF|nr:ral GTPase-activating protein subunit alpha-2-like isoform X2 [Mustela putorius furo]
MQGWIPGPWTDAALREPPRHPFRPRMQVRSEGVNLFLLWLQALQTNFAEEQVLIFACLVPGFPAIMSSRGTCMVETLISPSPGVADDIPHLRPAPVYVHYYHSRQ